VALPFGADFPPKALITCASAIRSCTARTWSSYLYSEGHLHDLTSIPRIQAPVKPFKFYLQNRPYRYYSRSINGC
jgi:hypothetical protein